MLGHEEEIHGSVIMVEYFLAVVPLLEDGAQS